MEELIMQVKDLTVKADGSSRVELVKAFNEAQALLETPQDTLLKLFGSSLQLAILRIANDLSLLTILNESGQHLSLDDLAGSTKAAPELLGRILRFLASYGYVNETSQDNFSANGITKLLADPRYQGAIYHGFDICGPVLQAFPDFLAETKYQDITDSTNTPFQKAFTTNLPCFAWLAQHPKHMNHVKQTMMTQQSGDWLDIFPIDQELGSWSDNSDKALFVDIGGSAGHQCIEFKKRYPGLPGRIILQDIPETLEHVKPIEGVRVMAQNFFEPQKIVGAKFYYLRAIFHDYPDDQCIEILKNLVPAMDEHSRILIDEVVLSDVEIPWQAAMMDIMMMVSFGARERRREQWETLLKQGGVKILHIHNYNKTIQRSVIVAAPM